MTRFSHNLALNGGHLTFHQKFNHTVMQIFGHEALFPVYKLRHNSHCTLLDTDIYRIGELDYTELAKRKLFNPFKLLEFCLVMPIEMLIFAMTECGVELASIPVPATGPILLKLASYGVKLIGISLAAFMQPIYVVGLLVTGTLQLLLAPVRKIVRPAVELSITQPNHLTLINCITLAAAVTLTVTLLNPVLALMGALITWVASLKLVTLSQDFFELYKSFKSKRETHCQHIELFVEGDTEKITEMLHSINPRLSEMKLPNEQDTKFSLALFAGTEAVFFKRQRLAPTCKSTMIQMAEYDKRYRA
jgi:hypothetical protein